MDFIYHRIDKDLDLKSRTLCKILEIYAFDLVARYVSFYYYATLISNMIGRLIFLSKQINFVVVALAVPENNEKF